MKEIHVDCIVLILTFFVHCGFVRGIVKNNEQNIIREEDRRGTGMLENEVGPDQATYDSLKRDVWAIGQNSKSQHNDCEECQPNVYPGEYGSVAPDNLGYPLGSGAQYDINTKINEPGYGFGQSSGGNGVSYGYSGGSVGSLGYGGGGIDNLGYSGGGIGTFGHVENGIDGFGHGGGLGIYGHSGGGIGGFGHSAAGINYGHNSGGFGGLTSFIHKKITLKKLILPIAAIALLGAAAAMSTNPVLLQLGTISGRRKRSIPRKLDRYNFPQNPFVRPTRV